MKASFYEYPIMHEDWLEAAAAVSRTGLPMTAELIQEAFEMYRKGDTYRIHYDVDFPDYEDLERVTERMRLCAGLIAGGRGRVPENSRRRIGQIRDLMENAANAMTLLLEAKA